jgi:hypothetical protein
MLPQFAFHRLRFSNLADGIPADKGEKGVKGKLTVPHDHGLRGHARTRSLSILCSHSTPSTSVPTRRWSVPSCRIVLGCTARRRAGVGLALRSLRKAACNSGCGLLLSAVAYVIFAFATLDLAAFSLANCSGLGGGTIGVVQAYVSDVSDTKDRAKMLGCLSAVTSLGAVIGPAIDRCWCDSRTHGTWFGIGRAVPARQRIRVEIPEGTRAGPRQWRWQRRRRPHTGTGAIKRVLSRSKRSATRLIWIYAIAIGAFYGTNGDPSSHSR